MNQKAKERAKATGHSTFSPSQLPRIIACPGSYELSLYAPIEQPSSYALAGTLQHDVVANVLLGKTRLAEVNHMQNLQQSQKANVQEAVDYIQRLMLDVIGEDVRDDMKIEFHGSLGPWGLGEVYGTCDVRIECDIDGRHILYVIDWKFGQGVQVFAEDNAQMLAYAACAIRPDQLDQFDEIRIVIVQPPLNHIDEWVITPQDLQDWVVDTLTNAIESARSDNPEFNPGAKQCRFCPAGRNMMCTKRYDAIHKDAGDVFKALAASEPKAIPIADLVALFDKCDDVIQMRKDIANYLEAQYFKGEPVPGKKFVAGRGQRKWGNEALATIYLEQNLGTDKAYEKKLLSVAKAEKVNSKFKKDDGFKNLVTVVPGKPQMVKEDDKRPAIKPESLAENKFKAVID